MNDGEDRVWYGVLKSTLQKHVRRGEADKAVRIAAQMMRLNEWSLRWRWPIIVAEDVLGASFLLPQSRRNFLGVVHATVSMPKNKETWGLYCEMKERPMLRKDLDWFSGPQREIEKALDGGEVVRACKTAWLAWSTGKEEEVMKVLSRGKGAEELLDRCRRTKPENYGCETMFTLAGAVLVAAGKAEPVGIEIKVPEIRLEDVPPMDGRRVAWYGCDPHTVPGRMALGAMSNRVLPPGIDGKKFGEIWFWCESAKLGDHVEHKHFSWDESMRRDGVEPEDAKKIWRVYREDVKKMVLWATGKNGIEVDLD